MSIGTKLQEKMNSELKKFQLQGVRKAAEENFRMIIADDMGLGKTIQAIACVVLNYPEKTPVICVVPASVKYHWKREFKRHAGITAEVIEGRKPYKTTRKVLIINYQIIQYWLNYLLKLGVSFLIMDECHYVKNIEAKRTIACGYLANDCDHILALSGTPVLNTPAEIYPVLRMIKPKKFHSWEEFAWRYCDPKPGYRGSWDYTGAKNLVELNRKISPFMIRRLKKNVEAQLPKKQRIVIPVDINNRKEYKRARDDFTAWLHSTEGAGAVKRASGALALVRLLKLKQLAAHGKMKDVFEWIDDFLTTKRKLVVFAIHKPIIEMLHARYKNRCVLITGSVPNKQRQINVDRFVLDKKIDLIFGNLHAMGTGVDGLQKASSTTLTVELGWNDQHHQQAEDRVLRIGQNAKSCQNYYIVGKDTVEEWLLEIAHLKQIVVDKILEGERVKDRISLYKLMQRI